MGVIDLSFDEARLLWNVCNAAQDRGLQTNARLVASLGEVPDAWLAECVDEFDILQTLKAKADRVMREGEGGVE